MMVYSGMQGGKQLLLLPVIEPRIRLVATRAACFLPSRESSNLLYRPDCVAIAEGDSRQEGTPRASCTAPARNWG
jgi:hypothetical protein